MIKHDQTCSLLEGPQAFLIFGIRMMAWWQDLDVRPIHAEPTKPCFHYRPRVAVGWVHV